VDITQVSIRKSDCARSAFVGRVMTGASFWPMIVIVTVAVDESSDPSVTV
jgi:hypothetical protein